VKNLFLRTPESVKYKFADISVEIPKARAQVTKHWSRPAQILFPQRNPLEARKGGLVTEPLLPIVPYHLQVRPYGPSGRCSPRSLGLMLGLGVPLALLIGIVGYLIGQVFLFTSGLLIEFAYWYFYTERRPGSPFAPRKGSCWIAIFILAGMIIVIV